MFKDPSFFTKEAKGQSKNGDIQTQEKESDIKINNTNEFLKENSMATQVFQEDTRLEIHKNISYIIIMFLPTGSYARKNLNGNVTNYFKNY